MSPRKNETVSKKAKKTIEATKMKKKDVAASKQSKLIKEKLSGKNYSPIVASAQKAGISLKKKRNKNVDLSKRVNVEGSAVVVANGKVHGNKTKATKNKAASIPSKNMMIQGDNNPKQVANLSNGDNKSQKKKIVKSKDIPKSKNVTVLDNGPSLKRENASGGVGFSKSKKRKVAVKSTTPPAPENVESEQMLLKSCIINPNKKAILEKKRKKQDTSLEKKQVSSKNRKLTVVASTKPQDPITGDTDPENKPEVEGDKTKKIKGLKLISNAKTLEKKRNLKKPRLMKKPTGRGVVVFKNIPHGFYEIEIKKYCSQFGKVTGVYHPVSKNGNSRGYAFVEFAVKEVAKIVAETMNNYVMFYKRMRCEFVPDEKQRPWVFRREKSNADLANERRIETLKQSMRNRTKEELVVWQKRKEKRVRDLHKKLASKGVDYEFKVANAVKLEKPLEVGS